MKKFSFVIPVYNAEKSLKRCVNSVLKQSYNNIEVVCVNDGSTDSSLKILEKIKKNDDRVKIVSQENRGAFMARKNGILHTTGDYILFVDADDRLINSNACKILLDIFERENVQIVQYANKTKRKFLSSRKTFKVEGLITKDDFKYKYYKDYLSGESEGVITVTLWNKAFDANIMRDVVSGFDSSLILGEDLLLFLNYIDDERFCAMLNTDELIYLYNAGIGYSGKLDGTILQEYDKLKDYQMRLCDEWQLSPDAKYFCTLESIYFMMAIVIKMINEKQDVNIILKYINEASGYKCIKDAKEYLCRHLDLFPQYSYKELIFLISDYTPSKYLEYINYNKIDNSIKNKCILALKRILKI